MLQRKQSYKCIMKYAITLTGSSHFNKNVCPLPILYPAFYFSKIAPPFRHLKTPLRSRYPHQYPHANTRSGGFGFEIYIHQGVCYRTLPERIHPYLYPPTL